MILLDSSALLAVIFAESGHQVVEEAFPEALVSAVNYAEVITRQVRAGVAPRVASSVTAALQLEIVAWTGQLAEAAADLAPLSRSHGLPLGDRACLATARHLGLPVLTADRRWSLLPPLGIDLRFIR